MSLSNRRVGMTQRRNKSNIALADISGGRDECHRPAAHIVAAAALGQRLVAAIAARRFGRPSRSTGDEVAILAPALFNHDPELMRRAADYVELFLPFGGGLGAARLIARRHSPDRGECF